MKTELVFWIIIITTGGITLASLFGWIFNKKKKDAITA